MSRRVGETAADLESQLRDLAIDSGFDTDAWFDDVIQMLHAAAQLALDHAAEIAVARLHLSIDESKSWHLGLADMRSAIRAINLTGGK